MNYIQIILKKLIQLNSCDQNTLLIDVISFESSLCVNKHMHLKFGISILTVTKLVHFYNKSVRVFFTVFFVK